MPSTDIKSRFLAAYEGDIRDPILTTLLDTIEAYQQDVQDQLLLTTYAQRSDEVSDGLFEVLRRHLFGQLFPGPAFTVLQASLREVQTAPPILLQQHHYFSVQDQEGAKVLFAPQHPAWIVPATTNDVKVQVFGDDISLGVSVLAPQLAVEPDGFLSMYIGESDPLIIERMRCRLPERGLQRTDPSTILRTRYPGQYTHLDSFFQTPYERRFLRIPFQFLTDLAGSKAPGEVLWIPFQGLGRYSNQLEKKIFINAFPAWNMVEGRATAIGVDAFRFRIQPLDHARHESIITEVHDVGTDPPAEYVDAASVMDPAYPFQFTSSADVRRDEIVIAMSPPPQGEVKVHYYQYDLGELCLNIAAGRSYALYQGIDERIKSVQSLTPTHRLNALNDKVLVWNYFRSMLASRYRWLTRDDLKAGVLMYPPFAGQPNLVYGERIIFDEKVGRVRGFLTPFTEIVVPVRDKTILGEPDKSFFERQMGLYLKQRTVSGNFIRVRLISAEEVA